MLWSNQIGNFGGVRAVWSWEVGPRLSVWAGTLQMSSGLPILVGLALLTFVVLWVRANRERDKAVAQEAWAEVEKFLQNPAFGMVVLDELNIAIHHEYVSLEQVLNAVAQRPPMLHVVITGRGAKPELIEAADLVSEMKMIKHPFRNGIKAQKGVEF